MKDCLYYVNGVSEVEDLVFYDDIVVICSEVEMGEWLRCVVVDVFYDIFVINGFFVCCFDV